MMKRVCPATTGASAMALAIALAVTAPALAQEAPASSAPSATSAEAPNQEIIVTGSRLGRTSFNSPTPVNVVGQERVKNLNMTSVGDALNQIPSFRPITSPATSSYRSSANIAGRSLDLRGLGAIRTLTLLDGKRHVASGDDNTFDLNSVPSIMIQRSEVVTGGASAAYGAGAVAGVVNLIVDSRFTGVKAEASYGITEEGDGPKYYAAFEAGTAFAGGRGHIVVGGEYLREGQVGDINSRAWSRKHHDVITNPFFSTNPALSNGLPANIATDNVVSAMNPAGVISIVNPLQGYQFNSAGNLVPFQFGALFNRARPSTLMVGGDPSTSPYWGAVSSPFYTRNRHYALMGHAEYELTDDITAIAEVSYAKANGGPTGANPRSDQNGALVIRRDNAFLTAQTAAMMDAAGATTLPLSRINLELGANTYSSVNNTVQASLALKGGLFSDWKWDGFYQFGRTTGTQSNAISRLEARFTQAIDAVFAPAGVAGIAPGTIICRSTIANPTNGCVPANIMGPDKLSAAAAAWINTRAYSTRRFTQNQVAANLRGTVIQGWAGPIKAAIGGEYRTEGASGDNDPNSKLGLFSQNTWTLLPASTQKVTEGYLEANLPVFKDWALGKSLELDGAVRRTHYSLSGNATTWKIGAVYQINDEYMLRVTRSRDIRAPTPLELNPNTTRIQLPLNDPKYLTQYIVPTFTGGNPNLKLEKGNTLTIGGVFQPHWLPRFRLSVDYYDIKVSGSIDSVGGQAAMNLCRTGNYPQVCQIGTDASGNPDRVLQLFATYQNVNQLHARGIEIVSNYSIDLANVARAMSGRLDISINGSYVNSLSTTLPDGTKRELSNTTGNIGGITNVFGVPRWRADAIMTYDHRTYALTAHMSYIPRSILNPDWIGSEEKGYSPYLTNSVTYNHISPRFYMDLSGRVKLYGTDSHRVELFGGVENLFNTDPPSQIRMSGNPLYYDSIGRRYKVGLRANW